MRIAPVRRTVLGGLAVVVVSLAGAIAATGSPPPLSSAFYLVEPDPRLCPSPLCGGYWVSLANRELTRCHDGAFRGRCYVARGVDEHRHPLEGGLPAGGLARADLEPWAFEGLGKLGVLVVARAWPPIGSGPRRGAVYRLRDTGIRCIRAPCFWLRASALNRSSSAELSDLDLRPVGASPAELRRSQALLRSRSGLFATGKIAATPIGGRKFRAERLFLDP
jgi:hypothetical protein